MGEWKKDMSEKINPEKEISDDAKVTNFSGMIFGIRIEWINGTNSYQRHSKMI